MTEYDVPNFAETAEGHATGAQPSIKGFDQLKEAGYTAVVNISPMTTNNYLTVEAGLTERLGLAYVHYPVDCTDLQDRHFSVFAGIMEGLKDERVFVHCGGNIKSSNLMHMYRVLKGKVDEGESFAELLKIQNPEPKWIRYFESHGMKGDVRVRGAA